MAAGAGVVTSEKLSSSKASVCVCGGGVGGRGVGMAQKALLVNHATWDLCRHGGGVGRMGFSQAGGRQGKLSLAH